MKTKIEVEINKIKVEKGYFSFDYIVTINDKIIEKRIKNNLIIRFLESLFSRLIITKKLLNLDKKIYEFML